MAKSKHSLGQMIDSVRESIRDKWNSMHVATPAQRKALRKELSDALSGLGKTVKQYDPRNSKKTAAKKAAKQRAPTKKASPAKRKPVAPKRSAKKTALGKRS